MAITKIRGNTQIIDATVTREKLSTDFLAGSDWDLSGGNGNATITGLANPLYANDAATKDYVDTLVDASLKTPEAYDPTTTGNYPITYGGEAIQAGDSFRITAAQANIGDGTRSVNTEDLLIAIVDSPSATVGTDWMVAESNRTQATESTLGLSKIATQAITNTGTNDTDYITPLKLATYVSNEAFFTQSTETYGDRITAKTSINELFITKTGQGLTGIRVTNADDVNNYTGSYLALKGSGAEFTNQMFVGHYGASYYVTSWAGNSVLASDKQLMIAAASATGKIVFQTGGSFTAPVSVMQIETDGTLSSLITNYETLVTADDDIPNKKYVDDEISAAIGGAALTYTNGLTLTGSDVELGGTLESATGINLSTFDLTFTSGGGLVKYAADYSGSYDSRTLVDQGYTDAGDASTLSSAQTYADTHINGKTTTTIDALNTSTGPGAAEDGYALTWDNTGGEYVLTAIETPVTFQNGLTDTSNTVELGGALVKNTTIDNAGFAYEVSGSGDNTIETSVTGAPLNIDAVYLPGVTGLGGTTNLVQTFTAAGDTTITDFTFYVRQTTSITGFTAILYQGDQGAGSGTALKTVSSIPVSGNTVTFAGSIDTYEIVVSFNQAMTAGTGSIEIYADGYADLADIPTSGSSGYNDGFIYWSANSGSSYTAVAGSDLSFKLVGTGGTGTGQITTDSTGATILANDGANNSSIAVGTGSMVVTDAINTTGLTYAADYSTNFVDRSLVDKAYVDGAITSAGLTFENGLTETSGTVKLGGTITEPTTLDTGTNLFTISGANLASPLNEYAVTFDDSGLTLNAAPDKQNNGAELDITMDNGGMDIEVNDANDAADQQIRIQYNNSGGLKNRIELSSNGILVTDSGSSGGIRYAADYSGDFTTRSLVDKAYVDGLVDPVLKSPDSFDAAASTGGAFPTVYKATGVVSEGDTFYVTSPATLGSSTTVNTGDLLVANVDNPGQTDANWYVLESNRDQATESILGVAAIATQAEADAGTNDTDIITPLKLATYLSNASITEITASNGLTKTVNNITLGGTWDSNVNIAESTSGDRTFVLDSSDGGNNYLYTEFGRTFSGIQLSTRDTGDTFNWQTGIEQSTGSTAGIVKLYGGSSVNAERMIIEMNSQHTDGIFVQDGNSSKGFYYAADYSANWGDRNLVDKAYVDGHINGKTTTTLDALNTSTGPGAAEDGYSLTWNNTAGEYVLTATETPLTFENGLTETSNTVKLGGTLTEATTVAKANFALNLTGQGNVTIQSDSGVTTHRGTLQIAGASTLAAESIIGVQDTGSGNNSKLHITSSSISIIDEINSKGAVYGADYSANYTLRSLVDKEYVDTLNGKLTHYANELPTVTGGAAAVGALSNLGTHTTDKVTNVKVYLNGVRQTVGGGNDYTLNAATGVITFTFNLQGTDVVLVDYDANNG